MKRLLPAILLLTLITACTMNTPPKQPVVEPTTTPPTTDAQASYTYTNGVLEWHALIEKPTPCHTIEVNEQLLESNPPQVIVDLTIVPPEPGLVCAQVIEPESFQGSINTGTEPRNVQIRLEGASLLQG